MSDSNAPSKFYKYRSMAKDDAVFVESTIRDRQIYFSSPSRFNDIFDCRPVIDFRCSDAEFIEYYVSLARKQRRYQPEEQLRSDARQAIGDLRRDLRTPQALLRFQQDLATTLQKTGVYCVSEKNDDILMWSHYADNHSGICLEFDSSSLEMKEAQRVVYAEARPVIDQFKDTDTQTKMEKALLTKSAHWSYECEWRIIHQVKGVGLAELSENGVTGIIFGAAASDETKQKIRTVLKTSRNESDKAMPLYQATADDRCFKIAINRIR